jgi:DNA-binding NarL/FixJ family response regulator
LHRRPNGYGPGIGAAPDPDPVRVLIVDDHRLFTEALGLVIDAAPGIEVAATVASGKDAVHFARTEGAHVVVMDWRMPIMDGVETTRELLAVSPDTRVILISSADEDEVEADATAAGVTAFLSKTGIADRVVAAVRRAAHGLHGPGELPVLEIPPLRGFEQRAP